MFDFLKAQTKDYHSTTDLSWIWGILCAVVLVIAVMLIWRFG